MQFSAASDRGRVRSRNEDTFSVISRPDGVLAAVADGMGGLYAGNVASALAISTLEEFSASVAMAQLDLVEVYGEINRRIRERAGTEHMGTTLTVACVLEDGGVRFAHVGDSRLYHWAPGPSLTQLTQDHSLLEELSRAGQPRSASHQSQRHMLTRAVGVSEQLAVDTGHAVLKPGERLLLCTDGIIQYFDEDELATMLGNGISGLAERFVQAANQRGGSDNATAVILARQPERGPRHD